MITRRAVAAGILAGGIARAAPARAAEDVLERIARTGILRIGAVPAQPPYSYRDAATGAWAGFMIDIARDLAAEHGARIAPVESTWGNAVLDVVSDKVDIFFGLAPTPQRALAVDFSKPLYENAFSLIARDGFAPARWQDLNAPQVRVALELGTVYDQNVATLCPLASVIRLKTNNDALMAVQAGRADCQILVVILALTTLARNPSLGHLIVPQPLFGSATGAIMAKAATPAWRDAVDAWITRRRAAGQLREVLVANLEKVGVRAADVPPQLLF
jgi:polar amino acid transport system substrate-binding protein